MDLEQIALLSAFGLGIVAPTLVYSFALVGGPLEMGARYLVAKAKNEPIDINSIRPVYALKMQELLFGGGLYGDGPY